MVYDKAIKDFCFKQDDIIIAFCFDSITAKDDDFVIAYIDGDPPIENAYEWIKINPIYPNWKKVEKQIQKLILKIKKDSTHRYILCDMYQAIDNAMVTNIIDYLFHCEEKNVNNLIIPERMV